MAMVTLGDLRRKTARIKVGVGDDEIEVRGLPSIAILDLMDRWDAVRKFLVQLTISPAEAFKQSPHIGAAVIARGTPLPEGMNMAEAEAVALEIPIGDALNIFEKIWELTFAPAGGFGPLVDRVRALARAASVVTIKAPDTRSELRSQNMRKRMEAERAVLAAQAKTSRRGNSRPGSSTPPDAASPPQETPSTS